ncbi:MAG: cellulase family glycosylhydrolase, partial [Verrucomicrobiia bacterium]
MNTTLHFGLQSERSPETTASDRSHRRFASLGVFVWLLISASVPLQGAEPIRLHPQNPHYFEWRGKPTLLISSAEHYGGALNLDFDYQKYIDRLSADGMNYTRVFSGAYVEPDGAFKIARNTLAPRPGRFICPWARSDQTGYANGGNKFDLSKWDPAYFARLKGFVSSASTAGIVVELTLFCPMYDDTQWRLSPMNAANNVNGVGAIARTNVHTIDRHGGLLSFQESLVRKLVSELNQFDNVIFEICNEPYFGGVTIEWQRHIADVIVETERNLPNTHLISQNIANKSARIQNPHPAVSVFNFHYAAPPETVSMNYHLNKAIGDDETGFRGTNNVPYRTEGWDFIIAGGALYNNLDYSFAAGYEDGTFVYPASQPGGGNPTLRRQLKILQDFMRRFNFVSMRPDNTVIKGGVPPGGTARALVEPGKAMAVYLTKQRTTPKTDLQIELPPGRWDSEWVNTRSGNVVGPASLTGGAVQTIQTPN